MLGTADIKATLIADVPLSSAAMLPADVWGNCSVKGFRINGAENHTVSSLWGLRARGEGRAPLLCTPGVCR